MEGRAGLAWALGALTVKNIKIGFIVSVRLSSGGLQEAAARSASLEHFCPQPSELDSRWSSRGRRAALAARSTALPQNTLGKGRPRASWRFQRDEHCSVASSIVSRHSAESVNGRSGKAPSSGGWRAPNSRLKPTRPRSLACSVRTSRASRWPQFAPAASRVCRGGQRASVRPACGGAAPA